MTYFADEHNEILKKYDKKVIKSIYFDDEGMDTFLVIEFHYNIPPIRIQYDHIYEVFYE